MAYKIANNLKKFRTILKSKKQIQKEAEKLVIQMLKETNKIDCMCPDCGTEFQIDG